MLYSVYIIFYIGRSMINAGDLAERTIFLREDVRPELGRLEIRQDVGQVSEE
jgi:hypothetical protein